MLNIPIGWVLKIDGIRYNQHTHNNDIKEGDLVLDTKDGTYGVCDMIHKPKKTTLFERFTIWFKRFFWGKRIERHIVIKEGWVSECGVPMSRVRLLKPALETQSLN